MTDKQIIIDGIDVSGCDFLAKEDDYSSYSGVTYAYKGQCGCSDEEMCKDHPNCFYKKALKQLKRKEQECEGLKGRLKYIINENKILKDCATDEHIDIVALKNYISTLEFHNDQLKAEVKSKTEYIQEQREIIDQYSKEIEMYKKCQGKRASKREEELKAENEELKEQLELNTANAVVIDMAQRLYNYKQAIEKIKELIQKEIDDCFDCGDCISCGYNCCLRQAMQICNEVLSE